MRTGEHFPNHAESGHTLAWTVAILALIALAQLLYFTKTDRAPALPPVAPRPEPVVTTVPSPVAKKPGHWNSAAPQASPAKPTDSPAGIAKNPLFPAVPNAHSASQATGDLPDSLPPVETDPGESSKRDTPDTAAASGPLEPPSPALPDDRKTAGATPTQVAAEPAVLPRDDLKLLVAEAVRLRRAGDMAGAIGKINAAIDAEPGHPRLLFELAATYEAMGMTERALDAYRNVAAMGPQGAGALLPIVERRLKDGLDAPGKGAPQDEPLYLGAVEEIPKPGDEGETRILRFDIHARPGAALDPTRLTLPVKFFDIVAGRQIEPSMADTPEVRWITPPVDWKEPGIETVEVTYHLPAEKQESEGGQRKYLGYRVELYYQDALLDVMARPRRLAVFQDAPTAPSGEPGEIPGLPDSLPEMLPETLGGPLLGP